MSRIRAALLSLAVATAAAFLVACGDPTKQDIIKKSEKADTKEKLEKALGRPSDIAKLGPVERWIYKAKDGTVVFVITGERVALSAGN